MSPHPPSRPGHLRKPQVPLAASKDLTRPLCERWRTFLEARTPWGRAGLTLLSEHELGAPLKLWRLITFTATPGTNLSALAAFELPILNHGRSELHPTQVDGAPALFFNVRAGLSSPMVLDELLLLQRMPSANFREACKLNRAFFHPNELHFSLAFDDALLSGIDFPMPEAEPAVAEEDDAFPVDPAYDADQRAKGNLAVRLILASLRDDPTQTDPRVALKLHILKDGEHTLAEWVEHLGWPADFAFRVHTLDAGEVWILYSEGVFVATHAEQRGLRVTPSLREVGDQLFRAMRRTPVDPELARAWAECAFPDAEEDNGA